MAEGRGRFVWEHTANILATLANGLFERKPGQPPFHPDQINPFKIAEQKALTPDPKKGFDLMKTVFVDQPRQ